jgi:hypothetical protein
MLDTPTERSCMQTAAIIQDEVLLLEGCVRVHNALLPLLVLPRQSRLLVKALLSVHAALPSVHNLVQDSFNGQERNRRAAAQALAALTLHAVQLAQREEEAGLEEELGSLKARLFHVYDPLVAVDGRSDSDKPNRYEVFLHAGALPSVVPIACTLQHTVQLEAYRTTQRL